ncbi:unnamed protein product [Linum tenue]|uniref:Pentatricopeptide repeat-containing protein n=1 Tax=Linum tenue TaxID=586396 RepID=A0AAV0K139_9ROSI|nr:unnamed protein product [Linum tenue]
MFEYGVFPNKYTYPFVLKACAAIQDLKLGKSVHGSVLKFGFDDDIHVQNTLVHMYCCDTHGSAIIGGYARLKMSADAVQLFRDMQSHRVRPDEITMIQKNTELYNALIDMFAKCGDVDKAVVLFRSMDEKRSIISWTSVIVGLAMHGHMLCRAGLVKEAFEFVQEMPIEPNPIIGRTLINACRAHGELKLGEEISAQLIKNDPLYESNYVLLSDIYAKMSDWEKKRSVREAMEKKGMKKIPGRSQIELENEIHKVVPQL